MANTYKEKASDDGKCPAYVKSIKHYGNRESLAETT